MGKSTFAFPVDKDFNPKPPKPKRRSAVPSDDARRRGGEDDDAESARARADDEDEGSGKAPLPRPEIVNDETWTPKPAPFIPPGIPLGIPLGEEHEHREPHPDPEIEEVLRQLKPYSDPLATDPFSPDFLFDLDDAKLVAELQANQYVIAKNVEAKALREKLKCMEKQHEEAAAEMKRLREELADERTSHRQQFERMRLKLATSVQLEEVQARYDEFKELEEDIEKANEALQNAAARVEEAESEAAKEKRRADEEKRRADVAEKKAAKVAEENARGRKREIEHVKRIESMEAALKAATPKEMMEEVVGSMETTVRNLAYALRRTQEQANAMQETMRGQIAERSRLAGELDDAKATIETLRAELEEARASATATASGGGGGGDGREKTGDGGGRSGSGSGPRGEGGKPPTPPTRGGGTMGARVGGPRPVSQAAAKRAFKSTKSTGHLYTR